MSAVPTAAAVRPGDVFDFSYSGEERAKRFEPNHCFDGQLVAFEHNGEIVLLDSYWLHNFSYSGGVHRRLTVAEAQALGDLRFKCNLDDVDVVRGRFETVYFDGADVVDLSYQHGCYPYFAVRKGAVRSARRMAAEIAMRIDAERSKIASANWAIERLTAAAEKVQLGELSEVWL